MYFGVEYRITRVRIRRSRAKRSLVDFARNFFLTRVLKRLNCSLAVAIAVCMKLGILFMWFICVLFLRVLALEAALGCFLLCIGIKALHYCY